MTFPFFSVIIVSYDSAGYLARCLAHLAAQTFRDFEIVIIDNGPDPTPLAVNAPAGLQLRMISTGANLGFAAGNNLGARAARGRWLALINPDAFPEPDWLERLAEAAVAYGGDTILTSVQINAEDPKRLDGAGDCYTAFGFPYRAYYGADNRYDFKDVEVFSPCGAAMAIERRAFIDVGGFDESFFCYCEDVDLGFRWRLYGGTVMLAAAARVAHVGSAVTGIKSSFSVYHGFRNRLWTYAKNMPLGALFLTLPLHLGAVAAALGGAFQAKQGWAAIRGLFSGVWGLPRVLTRRTRAHAPLSALWPVLSHDPQRIRRRLPPLALSAEAQPQPIEPEVVREPSPEPEAAPPAPVIAAEDRSPKISPAVLAKPS